MIILKGFSIIGGVLCTLVFAISVRFSMIEQPGWGRHLLLCVALIYAMAASVLFWAGC